MRAAITSGPPSQAPESAARSSPAEPASALSPADRAMLDYAAKLTRTPDAMCQGDVQTLRAAGFSDADILDIAQIAGYFNYSNRIANGLGVLAC